MRQRLAFCSPSSQAAARMTGTRLRLVPLSRRIPKVDAVRPAHWVASVRNGFPRNSFVPQPLRSRLIPDSRAPGRAGGGSPTRSRFFPGCSTVAGHVVGHQLLHGAHVSDGDSRVHFTHETPDGRHQGRSCAGGTHRHRDGSLVPAGELRRPQDGKVGPTTVFAVFTHARSREKSHHVTISGTVTWRGVSCETGGSLAPAPSRG